MTPLVVTEMAQKSASIRLICAVVAFLATVAPLAAQPVVHVRADAPPGGNGLTWISAFADLRDALDLASSSGGLFNEIWVAGGVYRPDRASGNRADTFMLFSGLKLRGGFLGTESSPTQRSPAAPPTILSGDIGAPGVAEDNSLHVVSMRTFFGPVTLDRLVIRDGRADGASFPNNVGGGFLNEGNATIIDCTFTENHAGNGGGLYSRIGFAQVIRCLFTSNSANSEGGGAFVRDAGAVRESVFSGNNAPFGGGLAVCCGTVRIADCRFLSNFGSFGGGLFNSGGGMVLTRSVFLGNSGSRGGALYTGSGSWSTNCFFAGNTAMLGGAVYVNATSNLVNCTFSRNFATESGGGLYAAAAAALSNCTLHGNNALLFAGGAYLTSGNSSIVNTIFWNNTDSTSNTQNAQITRVSGTLTVNHSLVKGWNGSLGGAGNFSANPKFIDPLGPDGIPGTEDDDFRLQSSSPCIDAGNTLLLPPDASDINENGDTLEPTPLDASLFPRTVDVPFVTAQGVGSPVVDIGAHEYQAVPPLPGDANGDGLVNFADITTILIYWGQSNVPADVDNSGIVDFGDVTVVLVNWGA